MSTFPLQTRTQASVTIIRPFIAQALSVSLLPLILMIGLLIALTGCSSPVEAISEPLASSTSSSITSLSEGQRWIEGVTHNEYGSGGVLEN